MGEQLQDRRICIIGIIVENSDSVEALNALLHEYGPYIIGRMGIPMKEEDISIISVVMAADQRCVSTLTGKLGRLDGVRTNVTYSTRSLTGGAQIGDKR